jgi:RecA-family ATPase
MSGTGAMAASVLAEVREVTQAAITKDMLRQYGIVAASTIAEEPTEWEWEGYLVRGALNLIEGNPETGKTLFVLTALANLSSGRPLPFGPADPKRQRRVLFLTAEDSVAKTVIGRLKAAGANLENVLVQKERASDLVFAGAGIDDLREIVRGARIGMIVLDPLNAYLDGVDINKEMEVRGALRPMRDFAEDENVTLVGLRHLNKATDKPALYRGGGSIALTAVARSTLLVAKHPEDSDLRVVISQKCNLIEAAKCVFRPIVNARIGAS